MRGLAALNQLKALEKHTKKQTWELFDIICGSGSGGLLALALGVLHMRIKDVELLFESLAAFAFKGSMGDEKRQKEFDEIIKEFFTDATMFDFAQPKVFVISGKESPKGVEPFLFRNFEHTRGIPKYSGSSLNEVSDAARATGLLPRLFPQVVVDGDMFHEASSIAVNPAAIALDEANSLLPDIQIDVLMSLGNGLPLEAGRGKPMDKMAADLGRKAHEVHKSVERRTIKGTYYRFDPGANVMAHLRLDESRDSALEGTPARVKAYMSSPATKAKLTDMYAAMGFTVRGGVNAAAAQEEADMIIAPAGEARTMRTMAPERSESKTSLLVDGGDGGGGERRGHKRSGSGASGSRKRSSGAGKGRSRTKGSRASGSGGGRRKKKSSSSAGM